MCIAVTTFGAAADPPGRFDYYVLSLSWSPQYCANSHRGDEPQCARPYAFVAHGLWPQYEQGYPQYEQGYPRNCRTRERVGEDTIAHLLPLMPSRSLIIHEWRTHGACSGVDPDDYFATLERAYRGVRIPERYQAPDRYLTVTPQQLKRDFIAANPRLRESGLAVQCAGHYLQELRVCLSRGLEPRDCGGDVDDRCHGEATLRPAR